MFECRTVCKQPSIKRLNFIRVRCRPIVGDQIQTPNHHHYHGLCLIFFARDTIFFLRVHVSQSHYGPQCEGHRQRNMYTDVQNLETHIKLDVNYCIIQSMYILWNAVELFITYVLCNAWPCLHKHCSTAVNPKWFVEFFFAKTNKFI